MSDMASWMLARPSARILVDCSIWLTWGPYALWKSVPWRADRARELERDEQALQAKRALYADLNNAARAYRVAAQDAVRAAERGESVDPAILDAAKDAWGDQYSQAQMALAKDVLQVASKLNRALGVGYSVVKQLPSSPDLTEAYERAKVWFSGPLSDGVWLLRVTLRHDLGVEVDPHFEQIRMQMLTSLDTARGSLERLVAAERARATDSAQHRAQIFGQDRP
ncbi:hypothetical protein [Streptomyces sp. NPDC096311]|uniref:hypothetical protein n=1 Tax=Streptomyces sp. NPDC096311 TaxID=3366083 RepID=UPI00380AF62A